jgi:ferredoxin
VFLKNHQEAFGVVKPGIDENGDLYIIIDGKSIPATNQRTLLEHAESASHKIPNSCRTDICGTCMVKVMKGSDENLSP